MRKKRKKEIVKEIKEKFKKAESVILTDFRGLDVHTLSELRKSLREKKIEFKVYKNTLIEIAAQKYGLAGLNEYLKGPTALVFGYEDAILLAKEVARFSKEHEELKIKAGIFEGEVVGIDTVKRLAELPSREELAGKLMGVLNAPISRLVSTLISPLQGLRNVVAAAATSK